MVRIINICSGKGGVGKTTVALNLAYSLQKFNRKVVVIDCNITTSHIGLYLGMYSFPVNLNSFLRNETRLEDAIYTHPSGIKFVPASLDVKDLININIENLKDTLTSVFHDYDFVLLDSAPGLGREAMFALQASNEILFVATPFIPSVVDVAKYTQIPDFMKLRTIGIVLNRVRNKNYELTSNVIKQFTNLPIIGIIPEDENILKSANKKTIVTFSKKNSPSSRAFFKLASNILGIEYKPNRIERILKILKLKRENNEIF